MSAFLRGDVSAKLTACGSQSMNSCSGISETVNSGPSVRCIPALKC